MTAKEKLAKARAGLILDHPFFGSLAMRLVLEESNSVPTAETNGKRIRYNPEFIEELTLDAVKGVICHEIMHCANQHHTRRDGRDMRKWNVACDYAINPLITSSGMSLPEGALFSREYLDMSAEQICARLPEPDENEGQGGGDGEGNDPGRSGGVEDYPGDGEGQEASEDEKSRSAQEWKVAVSQAAQQARAMGNLPGEIERAVGDIVDPVLNWKEVLHRFVDTNARNDYQWFPPNRRHIHNGFILPSLRSRELSNVTLAMDTSGSITDEDLKSFEAEVKSIVEDFGANATVIYCDSRVADVEHFDAGTPIELHPKGGGGTDFRPPFRHVEESGEFPTVMIYQTDGECWSFPEEPPYPVLWVLTHRNRSFSPPFGEVVSL